MYVSRRNSVGFEFKIRDICYLIIMNVYVFKKINQNLLFTPYPIPGMFLRNKKDFTLQWTNCVRVTIISFLKEFRLLLKIMNYRC